MGIYNPFAGQMPDPTLHENWVRPNQLTNERLVKVMQPYTISLDCGCVVMRNMLFILQGCADYEGTFDYIDRQPFDWSDSALANQVRLEHFLQGGLTPAQVSELLILDGCLMSILVFYTHQGNSKNG